MYGFNLAFARFFFIFIASAQMPHINVRAGLSRGTIHPNFGPIGTVSAKSTKFRGILRRSTLITQMIR